MSFAKSDGNINHMNRFTLPRIMGETKRTSLTGSETTSLMTSSTNSPEIDSDLEEMTLQEEDEEEDEEQKNRISGAEGTEFEQRRANEDIKQIFKNSEKEVRQMVKATLKRELRGIRVQATLKKNEIRRRFKTVIDDARSQLIASRIEAEKVSIDRLEERAELEQAKIMQERAMRKKEAGKEKSDESAAKNRTHSEELASLRKIQAELDRARARRRHSLAAAITTVNGKAKVSNLLQHEVRRLERAEEVQKLLVELHSLGLSDTAVRLAHSLQGKEESENRLRRELNNEQEKARRRATFLVEEEVQKVRKEYAAALERKERERLEREKLEKERMERERREQEMKNLKKLARDMAMKKMYKESVFNTSVSRPFSFSYFPTMKK
ncbi:PREDICTED: vicilin-like seed storage protein At2g18540 [Acropora digitifera]|uniref:vicilin-like seed storage protein At2g18540 n=1 Tax=Acropora digitifera TaxID=70779 RepID=UPI00077A9F87|nr:PREDICTED: vicilin-like seed storage protein At2g18540 [Acropora digitifera]